MEYEIVHHANSVLGEGPTWDEQGKRVFWLDGLGRQLNIFDPDTGGSHSFELPQPVGSLALTDNESIVALALQDGLYLQDISDGSLKLWHSLEAELPGNRFNDGKCDCMGRFWFGSMNTDANSGDAGCTATGSVYCLSAKDGIRKVFSGVTISNGMGWDKDNSQFYYIDSPAKSVFAFDFDAESGELSNKRVAVDMTSESGLPDGMSVDVEGMLWVAIWGGHCVRRFNPDDGSCIGEIRFPVKNITSCAFGGKLLDELYVTSSSIGAEGEGMKSAGSLFKVKTKTSGVPVARLKL